MSSITVLIYGDDLNRTKVLAYALAAVGMTPMIASGRAETLVRAAAGGIDAVVVDVVSTADRAIVRDLLRDLMPGLPVLDVARPIGFEALVHTLRATRARSSRLAATGSDRTR